MERQLLRMGKAVKESADLSTENDITSDGAIPITGSGQYIVVYDCHNPLTAGATITCRVTVSDGENDWEVFNDGVTISNNEIRSTKSSVECTLARPNNETFESMKVYLTSDQADTVDVTVTVYKLV